VFEKFAVFHERALIPIVRLLVAPDLCRLRDKYSEMIGIALG
jgi:hypothetical protein